MGGVVSEAGGYGTRIVAGERMGRGVQILHLWEDGADRTCCCVGVGEAGSRGRTAGSGVRTGGEPGVGGLNAVGTRDSWGAEGREAVEPAAQGRASGYREKFDDRQFVVGTQCRKE